MADLKKSMMEIERMREYLQKLINEKDDFIDPEILGVSKIVDVLLNEYQRLLNVKENNEA